VAPLGVRRRRAARRTAALQTQLADAIGAVASGVRGGLSTTQAIETAARRTSEPLAGSLRAVVEDTTLGSPLDDALDRWVSAIPVPDVRLAAAVLRMHRGTGGGFPVVLDGLARTLRERRAAMREVRSLTAQARLSGAILGLLPIAFFVFLWATSRRDMAAALGTPLGRTAIAVGVVLQAIAFLWIRRLLRVDA
jgi:tight adherence protein B